MEYKPVRYFLLAAVVVVAMVGSAGVLRKAGGKVPTDGILWAETGEGVVAQGVLENARSSGAPGIRPGDILKGIGPLRIDTKLDVLLALSQAGIGDVLTYTLVGNSEVRTVKVTIVPLGPPGIYYFLVFVGFASLVTGVFVLFKARASVAAAVFFLVAVSFFVLLVFSPVGQMDRFDRIVFMGDEIARLAFPALLLHFFLIFPEKKRLLKRFSWAVVPVYLPFAIILGLNVKYLTGGSLLAAGSSPLETKEFLDRAELWHMAVFFLFSILAVVHSYSRASDVWAKKQLRWVIAGAAGGLLPTVIFYLFPLLLGWRVEQTFAESSVLFMVLFPLCLSYAIIRYRLMDVEILVKKSLIYLLSSGAILVIYFVIMALLGYLLAGVGGAETSIAVLAVLVAVLLFGPVKSGVERWADRLFYRGSYDYRRTVIDFGRELAAETDLHFLLDRLTERLRHTLEIDRLAVFLAERKKDLFFLSKSVGFSPAAPVPREFTLSEPEALLRKRNGVSDISAYARELPAVCQAGVFEHVFPLVSKGRIVGFLMTGGKRSGPLHSEDEELLHSLSGYAATAVHNALLYSELTHKVREVQDLRELSENIIESSHVAILIADLADRVVGCNEAFAALFARGKEEVAGKPLDEVLPPSIRGRLPGPTSETFGDTIGVYKMRVTTSDGREHVLNMKASPLRRCAGNTYGRILVFDDVTERAVYEGKRIQEEKLAALGLISAGVAHEVNTPLTGISSYAQLLLEGFDASDPRYPILKKIEKQSFRASKIINNLLNFSRQKERTVSPVDLHLLVLDTLSLIEYELKRRSVSVVKDFDRGVLHVLGSEGELQQVFMNLFLNALDSMPGGGEIRVCTRLKGDDRVRIEVIDTGEGIPGEYLDRIFDPFFTTKEGSKGTGLGLSLTYGIVKEHAGSIFAESTVGKGSRFVLEFPARHHRLVSTKP
jgi:two-component system NtrC family sensor kinase